MIKDFEGKVVVITGGASGIGCGLAHSFAERGMKIVLVDIDKKRLERVAKRLKNIGAEVMTQVTDVSDPEQVAHLADASYERFGTVNILCNNAGVGGGGPLSQISLENWKWTLGVNLFGVIYGIQYFLNRMLESKEPCHIVNTSSMSGLLTGDSQPYPASKFAVVAISESLALECFNTNVGVSVVCPGFVNTKIIKNTLILSQSRPGIWQPTQEMIKQSRIRMENMYKLLKLGMAPKKLAELVIKAIESNILYVLTHPEYLPMVKSRFELIQDNTLKLHSGIEVNSPIKSKIFKNETPAFTLTYPENFIELKPIPMSFPMETPVFVAHNIPGIDLLIFIYRSSTFDRPLEENVQEIARRIEVRSREIKIISNKSITLRDGTPAYESVLEYKFLGIKKVKSIHLSVLKDEHRILIHIYADTNYFNEKLGDILHSLEFI